MALIKSAANNEHGHETFFHRHPILASGIALTGGIAAADVGTRVFAKALENRAMGKAMFEGGAAAAKHGLQEGLVYGGLLSAIEPAILHGGLRVPTHKMEKRAYSGVYDDDSGVGVYGNKPYGYDSNFNEALMRAIKDGHHVSMADSTRKRDLDSSIPAHRKEMLKTLRGMKGSWPSDLPYNIDANLKHPMFNGQEDRAKVFGDYVMRLTGYRPKPSA